MLHTGQRTDWPRLWTLAVYRRGARQGRAARVVVGPRPRLRDMAIRRAVERGAKGRPFRDRRDADEERPPDRDTTVRGRRARARRTYSSERRTAAGPRSWGDGARSSRRSSGPTSIRGTSSRLFKGALYGRPGLQKRRGSTTCGTQVAAVALAAGVDLKR